MRTSLQDETVRQAFEVEQITDGVRRNYTFEWNVTFRKIIVWNTSRGIRSYFKEDASPEAYENFVSSYKEAVTTFDFSNGIFLGWVDPVTHQPLDE